MLITILHEAAHHVDTLYTHVEADWAAGLCLREEDEQCDAADGMAADCNGGGTPKPETCTETQEWVPPVTIEVFVKPESSTLEQGSPVPTKHEAIPIPGITVSADSKGQWVEVVIEEGYWDTVTVCES